MLAAAALCAAALVAEAAAQSSPPDLDPDPIVAAFDGGAVRESDLDRERRHLAPREDGLRRRQGLDEADDRRDFARRVVLRVASRRAAAAEGLTADPRLAEAARAAGRRWYLGRWRQACYGFPLEAPSDAELLAELGPPRPLPERRRLSHVFLRATTAAELTAAEARLAAWRAEIRSLEQFQDIAARFSESQTARRRGKLGTVRPGWLPAAAERVIYDLPEGAMSAPVALRGGVHLFWIEKRFPAETTPPARRLGKLRAAKATAARDACRARRLAAVVVEGLAPGKPADEARRGWTEDEVLYQAALAQGAPTAEELRRIGDLEDDVWLREVVARRLAALLPEPSPEELRRRFDADLGRYRSPRKLAGRLLVARPPAGGDPIAFLDELTALSGRLARGEADWAEAARHGRTESFELQPALALAGRLGPFVFDQVKGLGPGEVSEPIQDGADFWVVLVDAEEKPVPLTFEEAQPRLRAAARSAAAAPTRARILGELLQSVGFRWIEPQG